MQTNVERTELLAILEKNREKHHDLYLVAMEQWRDQVVEELSQFTDRLMKGDKVLIRSRLPVPEDHTDDYDTAIQMLKLSVDDTIELSEHDIEEYVMDRWGWYASFAANTLRYTNGSQD